MATHRRLIFSLFLLLFLAGCSTQHERLEAKISQLESQNQSLQQQVSKLEAKNKHVVGNYYRYQHAAGVYQGCEAFFGIFSDMCTKSQIEIGKEAISYGYVGGGWAYWIPLTFKILAFSAGLSLFIAVMIAFFINWLRPNAAEIREARELINSAKSRADSIIEAQKVAEQKLLQTRTELAELVKSKEDLEIKESGLQLEIDGLERQAESKRLALDALNSF